MGILEIQPIKVLMLISKWESVDKSVAKSEFI